METLLSEIIALDQICFPDEAWAESIWIEKKKKQNTHILIHLEKKKLLGVIVFSTVLDESELLKIFVSPYHRGEKIAEKLIHRMERNLQKQNVESCFLEVRSDNLPAIQLYQKTGFSMIGQRKNYYRHPTCDALIFKTEIKG